MAKSKKTKAADVRGSMPQAWVAICREHWPKLEGVSIEYKVSSQPYVELPNSTIAVATILGGADDAKEDAARGADGVVHSAWKKAHAFADRQGRLMWFRLVLWEDDGKGGWGRITDIARGGKIDCRGDVARYASDIADEEFNPMTAMTMAYQQQTELVDKLSAALLKSYDSATSIVKSLADVGTSLGAAFEAAAKISNDGTERLRQAAQYDREAEDRRARAENTQYWANEFRQTAREYRQEFGPAFIMWMNAKASAGGASQPDGGWPGPGGAAPGGERPSSSGKADSGWHARDHGAAQDKKHGTEPHRALCRMAMDIGRTVTDTQWERFAEVFSEEIRDDVRGLFTRERKSDVEFKLAYLTIMAPLVPRMPDLAKVLNGQQIGSLTKLHHALMAMRD